MVASPPVSDLPDWIVAAQALPLAFALVREDPLQDQALVRQLGAEGRGPLAVLQIASGGCTAALLAREPAVGRLHLVDANPAQLGLTRLKLGLLSEEPRLRRRLLGHDPCPADERQQGLDALAERCGVELGVLGPKQLLAERGPDRCGRYEETFAALRRALGDPARLEQLLLAEEGPAQATLLAELEPELARAFAEVFALPGLIALFGPDATANRVQPFSAHFHQRTLRALQDPGLPARDNPYLWSVLLGRLPAEVVLPWLALPAGAARAQVRYEQAFVADALARAEGPYDYVHLSNVLDWLDPARAGETLARACAKLRPGGLLAVRQLNSSLDVRAAAPAELVWEEERSAELAALDRSYFYRELHVGRRV